MQGRIAQDLALAGVNAPEPGPEPEPERRALSKATAETTSRVVGTDSWKAWSGRKEGGDGFAFSDLLWGPAKMASHKWRRGHGDDRNGKECPVCFDDDPELDAEGKRWLRLYCGCTVCSSCVKQWSLSQMDAFESGAGDADGPGGLKLTCPNCNAPMRSVDAREALVRCPDVLERHELATRDRLLRSMPSWRSCPTCEGGGFVSSECLGPRNDERDALARAAALNHLGAAAALVAVALASRSDWGTPVRSTVYPCDPGLHVL
jgi:hypothetical protein